MPTPPSTSRLTWWLLAPLAWLLTVGLLSVTPFHLADWDSQLYARLSQQLAQAPLSSWIDPQWPPGYFKQGSFQEHPAPSLWPAALLGLAGLDGDVAAAAANLLFMLVVAWLLGILARDAWGEPAGHAASVAWVWSFVFIQFLWRARQEPPLTVGVLVAVLAAQRLGRHRAWGLVLVAGVLWCAAFKGAYGALVFPVCAAFGRRIPGHRWLAWMAASLLVLAAAVGLYEAAYHQATGGSFLRVYWDIQWGYTREQQADRIRLMLRGPYLMLAVLVWTLPWSPLLLARLRAWRRQPLDPALRATLWGLAAYLGFFSLFGRSASRHIFSAYALWTLGCAHAAAHGRAGPWLARHGQRALRLALLSVPLLAALRTVVGTGRWLSWTASFAQ